MLPLHHITLACQGLNPVGRIQDLGWKSGWRHTYPVHFVGVQPVKNHLE